MIQFASYGNIRSEMTGETLELGERRQTFDTVWVFTPRKGIQL